MSQKKEKKGLKIVTIGGGSSYTPELIEGFIKRIKESRQETVAERRGACEHGRRRDDRVGEQREKQRAAEGGLPHRLRRGSRDQRVRLPDRVAPLRPRRVEEVTDTLLAADDVPRAQRRVLSGAARVHDGRLGEHGRQWWTDVVVRVVSEHLDDIRGERLPGLPHGVRGHAQLHGLDAVPLGQ